MLWGLPLKLFWVLSMTFTEVDNILAGVLWGLLALKAVKEAPGVVTLLITLSILKEIPARDTSSTVDPWMLPIE